MRLKEKFNPDYEFVSNLRHTIRVRKMRNTLLRFSCFTAGVLLLYQVATLGIPYLIELSR